MCWACVRYAAVIRFAYLSHLTCVSLFRWTSLGKDHASTGTFVHYLTNRITKSHGCDDSTRVLTTKLRTKKKSRSQVELFDFHVATWRDVGQSDEIMARVWRAENNRHWRDDAHHAHSTRAKQERWRCHSSCGNHKAHAVTRCATLNHQGAPPKFKCLWEPQTQ